MHEMGSLEANTAALNRLAAIMEAGGGTTKTAAPVANGAAPTAEKRTPGRPRKITLDTVKAVAEELRDAKGKPAAVALIKKHGAESLAEMDEVQYPKFVAAAKAILNAEPEEDEAEDEGEGDDSL